MPNAPTHLVEMLKRYEKGDAQPFNAFAGDLELLHEARRQQQKDGEQIEEE
jgi:hypothetical protein